MPAENWNERISTLEQERRFKKLISLHSLTDSWISKISAKNEPAHRLERVTRVTLNPNLWQFEKSRIDHLPLNLEDLVGAQKINDFLNELEETIWIIQASTLENIASSTQTSEDLTNVLQQTSWNFGKQYAEAIWGTSGDLTLKEAAQAFSQTHFYLENSWITERMANHETTLIWKRSPRHDRTVKDSSAISLLCDLHEQVIQGYFHALSRSTRVKFGHTRLGEETYPYLNLLWSY
jgi:hypothetical protein